MDVLREDEIASVIPGGDGTWTVWLRRLGQGVSLSRAQFDAGVPGDLEPREGSSVQVHLHGDEVVGMYLGDVRLFDWAAVTIATAAWRGALDGWRDARVAALSAPLRRRIERLRANDPGHHAEEGFVLPMHEAADRMAAELCLAKGWRLGRVDRLAAKEAVNEYRAALPESVAGRESREGWRVICELAVAVLAGASV